MTFTTVAQVSDYVKVIIDDYRKFQSHKERDIEKLLPIFSLDAEAWKIVIDGGTFVTTFKKNLGKNRLIYLRKLLYAIDLEWYKTIDFGIE